VPATVAAALKKTCASLGIFYVFKASFDKANRTSGKIFSRAGISKMACENAGQSPRRI
jgi:3-deoxy-D-manno-octulosonic acid (KDO) 8-phosphate synthase